MRITGTFEEGFFVQNPEVRLLSPFKELLEEKGEEEASYIMWGLYLLEDNQSEFGDLLMFDREQQVKENYFEDPLMSLDKYESLRIAYRDHCMSFNEKLLASWKRKLEERDRYLAETPYEDDPEGQDKLLKSSKGIWEHFLEVEKKVVKDRANDRNVGDYKESALEKL